LYREWYQDRGGDLTAHKLPLTNTPNSVKKGLKTGDNIMEPKTKKTSKPLLGEILLEQGLITAEQLKKALKSQLLAFDRLGSVLVELGYLDNDSLLNILSRQHSVPALDLFKLEIPVDILKLVPYEKVKSLKILPINKEETVIHLAMVDLNDFSAIQDIEFAVGLRVRPYVVPAYQMETAIEMFERWGYGKESFKGENLKEVKPVAEEATMSIFGLLKLMVEDRGTDLHLTAGVPPTIRVDGEMKRLSSMHSITPEQMKSFVSEVLSDEQMERFEREKEIDIAISFKAFGRFRINIYKQRNSVSIAVRHIIENIPSLEELNLPLWLKDFALKHQGLILITGPSSHGKTTTLSALIDVINANRRCNIITLEDPIEYLHTHKKSNINQREIGVDTPSFAEGLKHIFRQDPDVIVIGEMRDPESIAIALTAAETGHMVLSTLHTLNATSAIDRIVDIFPPHQQHQVRTQFADAFLLIFSQRLIPRRDGKGRVPAYERITNTFKVRNMIRDGKAFTIRSLMQTASEDISTIDQSLAELCLNGKIRMEDGLKYADNPTYYKDLVDMGKKRI
jgi:twitching motility protein PilT